MTAVVTFLSFSRAASSEGDIGLTSMVIEFGMRRATDVFNEYALLVDIVFSDKRLRQLYIRQTYSGFLPDKEHKDNVTIDAVRCAQVR